MSVLYRRIRGRAPGHVVAINPIAVRSIEPTLWGGSEIAFSDVHVLISRDAPSMVQRLLEGRLRLCETNLCDRLSSGPFEPLCARCKAGCVPVELRPGSQLRANFVDIINEVGAV